ncbi:hypothetical protein OH77DRAFT_891471 [Trametes cingulata]|nr:hypothetical protein OH77DRAFT_891471 [Trametes cingulata]
MSRSRRTFIPARYRCPYCTRPRKFCKNLSGLTQHINTIHIDLLRAPSPPSSPSRSPSPTPSPTGAGIETEAVEVHAISPFAPDPSVLDEPEAAGPEPQDTTSESVLAEATGEEGGGEGVYIREYHSRLNGAHSL